LPRKEKRTEDPHATLAKAHEPPADAVEKFANGTNPAEEIPLRPARAR
jgi:hypothetical protein